MQDHATWKQCKVIVNPGEARTQRHSIRRTRSGHGYGGDHP